MQTRIENGDNYNIPISVDYTIIRQAKWLKKDWGRWHSEMIKFWKYIYSTLSEETGYKNKTAGLNGDSTSDYNHIYGNPCNNGDWIENEVNIYINDTMANQEDSDLNNLFRNSMLGMFYIGKSCEDFVNDLPTGVNDGGNCVFSNSEERCIGYLCSTHNINKSDPSSTICDGKLNNNTTTYKDIKNETIKRTERSKQAVISFVDKFNNTYRINKNKIIGYKLMTSSNAFTSWNCLNKLLENNLFKQMY